MTNLILIDTNIIVYTCDPGAPERQEQAIALLQNLSDPMVGRLSTQVLAEFINATTKGKESLLSRREALIQATRLAQSYPVFDLTPHIVLEAGRIARDHSLAYYDAQIWASAKLNNVPVIFTEDFQDGQTLEGVRFVNPFAENFQMEKWL